MRPTFSQNHSIGFAVHQGMSRHPKSSATSFAATHPDPRCVAP